MLAPILSTHAWGINPITPLAFDTTLPIVEIASYALHHKSDGAIGDKPSLCFECRDASNKHVFLHQVSLETLSTALRDFGYQIVEASKT